MISPYFEAKSTILGTGGPWPYHALWMTSFLENTFTFSIMTCQEAQVHLSQYPLQPDHNSYNIHIETHKISISNRDNGYSYDFEVDLVLHCDYEIPLWIQWGLNGNSTWITIGSGDSVGNGVLVEWVDPLLGIPITAAAFATEQGKVAKWTFSDSEGQLFNPQA